MRPPKNGVCPVCGAALQENARFCLRCMTAFEEKTALTPAENKKSVYKRLIPVICVFVLLLGGAAALLFLQDRAPEPDETTAEKKNKTATEAPTEAPAEIESPGPLIDYDTFLLAIGIAAAKPECAGLLDADSFLDVMGIIETNTVKYTADISLPGARLDLFFKNEGEVITLILSDVAPEDLNDAKRICEAVHGAVTNYYSDIYQVLTDGETYRRTVCEAPFEEFFTEMTGRTERYREALSAGASIQTEGVLIAEDDVRFAYFFETKRSDGEKTLYDLVLHFDYYGDPEL